MSKRQVIRRFSVILLAIATTTLLALPALGGGGRPLEAELSPDNEVPPASASSASGTAQVTLNQGQGEICVDIESGSYSGTVVAGHIHRGVAGTNGGVEVNLGVNSGDFSACVSVPKDLVKEIRQNPADFYVNIHTTAFPGGEVRGQLSK